jgi:hypothetical protein
MFDWQEAKDVREEDVSSDVEQDALSPEAIASIQGDVEPEDGVSSDAPEQSGDSPDLATVRPKETPEHLPNVERDGVTVDLDEGKQGGREGKVGPPPGARPGGPERGW